MARPKAIDVALPPSGVLPVEPGKPRDSLISMCVALQAEGYDADVIGTMLGVPAASVGAALRSDRAVSMRRQNKHAVDNANHATIVEAARSAYRLRRANEVLEDGMESADPWMRYQSATAVIAAEAKRAELARSNDRKIVIAPELGFDDQNLQDDQQAIAN